jgi:hypothetical protein
MSESKYTRRPVIDSSVADLLVSMEKKLATSQLPKKKREKLAKERAKIEARRDFRVTYDIPPPLRDAVRNLAEEQAVPASQLVSFALMRFLDDLDRKIIDLDKYKEASLSPRYDWNLRLPSGPIFIPDERKKPNFKL